MADTDLVAACLAEVRERANDEIQDIASSDEDITWSCQDVPRLLAAVEAALGLADGWIQSARDLAAMAGRAEARGADPMRTTLMSARAQSHQDCAQALRGAISAALVTP